MVETAICDQLIEAFENSDEGMPGLIGGGYQPSLKNSIDITLDGDRWQNLAETLNARVAISLLRYIRDYPSALLSPFMLQKDSSEHGQTHPMSMSDIHSMPSGQLASLIKRCFRPSRINLQRYEAGVGGYPYWHCEHYPKDKLCETLHRHLFWIAYLNDSYEQGETEFLHQSLKIKPQTGSILIAPTGFAHTHRGNKPINGAKYIATSWILFQRSEYLYGNH